MALSKTIKRWTSDPATYPIIVVIGAAVTLCVGASARYITKCPDVLWDKKNRQAGLRLDTEEALKWQSHKKNIARASENAINSSPSFPKLS